MQYLYFDQSDRIPVQIGDQYHDVATDTWKATYDATQLPTGLKYRRRITEPNPHNPDNLTPEQVGVSEGWRLLESDEIHGELSLDDVGGWACGSKEWNGCFGHGDMWKSITYRTKLSRAELRKARGLEPAPEPETRPPTFQEEQWAWVKSTFPDEKAEGAFVHLKSEIDELAENFADAEELADCFLLIQCLASHAGVDLMAAARAKFEKCKARTWVKTEAGYRHEKSGEATQQTPMTPDERAAINEFFMQGEAIPGESRQRLNHDLKTWPIYFQPVFDGRKTFELRNNDRGFNEGDSLTLSEFVPCAKCNGSGREWDNGDMIECCKSPHGNYTGRALTRRVTFVLNGPVFGLPIGCCIMALASEPTGEKALASALAEVDRYKAVWSDPAALHVNLLRSPLCSEMRDKFLHLAGANDYDTLKQLAGDAPALIERLKKLERTLEKEIRAEQVEAERDRLAAENAKLTQERDEAQQWIDSEPDWKDKYNENYAAAQARIDALEAEVARLRGALIRISQFPPSVWHDDRSDSEGKMRDAAQAALAEGAEGVKA
jgi:hypothetical protein